MFVKLGNYQLFMVVLSLAISQAFLESGTAKNQLLDSGELKAIHLPTCAVTVVRKHVSMCKQQF